MPDEERMVAQLAASFRRVLDPGEPRRSGAGTPDGAIERREEAVLVAAGAVLGDLHSLPEQTSKRED